MFTMVALYSEPDDPEAFEQHYRRTHLEICRRWPGLRSSRVVRFTGTPRGTEAPFFLSGEFTFADQAAFMDAMGSDSGKESQADARKMVEVFGVRMQMMLGEVVED